MAQGHLTRRALTRAFDWRYREVLTLLIFELRPCLQRGEVICVEVEVICVDVEVICVEVEVICVEVEVSAPLRLTFLLFGGFLGPRSSWSSGTYPDQFFSKN